jgi:DNA recombination protein RmuC
MMVLAFLAGGMAAWWIQYFRLRPGPRLNENFLRELEAQLAKAREADANTTGAMGRLQEEAQATKLSLENKQKELLEAAREIATLQTRCQQLAEQCASQESQREEIQKQMQERFELLSRRLLEETSHKFQTENRNRLEEVLNPLQISLKDFRAKVEQSQKEQTDYHGQLKNELQSLREANRKVTEEAENLVRALKGDSKTQGTWGEMILETLLEKSGLTRGEEYETQVSALDTREEEGAGVRLRPDVVIYYPRQKGGLVIDSKVSLTAYERYCNAENEKERETAAKDHLNSLRNHIRGLAAKNYHDLPGLTSPDFVLLFIPVEPALALAQRLDATLYEDAFSKNIVLITPSTLLATLKLVRHLWNQERQNVNALAIAERGGRLYDKFATLYEEIESLGMQMDRSTNQLQKIRGLLRDGSGNLLGQVDKLRKLGAKASKTLPESPESTEES